MQLNFEIKNKHFKNYHHNIKILCDGYILPKNENFEKYLNYHDEDLIFELYELHKDEFIHFVKGIFFIIIKLENKVIIFTDRLGLKKIYYRIDQDQITFSNQIEKLKINNDLSLDTKTLITKALLNREINHQTIFKNINSSTSAFFFKQEGNSFTFEKYWTPENLKIGINKSYDISYFENLLQQNILNLDTYFHPKNYSITLTGGKDSRTGLCTLLNLGIQPTGFTYGNIKSKDAVFARKLAKTAQIDHHVFDLPKNIDSIKDIIEKIISFKNPSINIHRAHRFYAFKQLENITSKKQVYIAGYMAGELLMGIYYDDTVFPRFLTQVWEQKTTLNIENTKICIANSFLKVNNNEIDLTIEDLNKLKTLNVKNDLFTAQLNGIFELGIPHHSQDIYLSSKTIMYPYPLFLDLDFLDAIFQSKYSFKYTNNKTKNILERYKLYYFNLNLQHRLFPKLSKVPFAKKGNYNTLDFLRGNFLWSFKKVLNYLKDREKYPPNFVYDKEYYDYVLNELEKIANDKTHTIHSFFDLEKAINKLKNTSELTQEKQWIRFTNIISTYAYFNTIKHEN